jgi:hypothetical protein
MSPTSTMTTPPRTALSSPSPADLSPSISRQDTRDEALETLPPSIDVSRPASERSIEPLSFAESGGLDDDLHEGQALPPVDRGKGAWAFCLSALALETFIWGFAYSFGTILVWLEVRLFPFSPSSARTDYAFPAFHSCCPVLCVPRNSPFLPSSLTTHGSRIASRRSVLSEPPNSPFSSSSRSSFLLLLPAAP